MPFIGDSISTPITTLPELSLSPNRIPYNSWHSISANSAKGKISLTESILFVFFLIEVLISIVLLFAEKKVMKNILFSEILSS